MYFGKSKGTCPIAPQLATPVLSVVVVMRLMKNTSQFTTPYKDDSGKVAELKQ